MHLGAVLTGLTDRPLPEVARSIEELGLSSVEIGAGGIFSKNHCDPALLLADGLALAFVELVDQVQRGDDHHSFRAQDLAAVAHLAQAVAQHLRRLDQPLPFACGTGDRVFLLQNLDRYRNDLFAQVPISIARSRAIMASTRVRAISDFSMRDARSATRLSCCRAGPDSRRSASRNVGSARRSAFRGRSSRAFPWRGRKCARDRGNA